MSICCYFLRKILWNYLLSTDRLTDWLTDWQTDRLTIRPIERPTGRPIGCFADWLIKRLIDWILCVSTKFQYQKIRLNLGIFRSCIFLFMKFNRKVQYLEWTLGQWKSSVLHLIRFIIQKQMILTQKKVQY